MRKLVGNGQKFTNTKRGPRKIGEGQGASIIILKEWLKERFNAIDLVSNPGKIL